MSMMEILHFGYFSAMALAIAAPTKPQPPVTRTSGSDIRFPRKI